MTDGTRLLTILLKASEKAANIARVCRQDSVLFKLLVQEKSDEEKNPRFFQDFKTLADVLIQETIRHDIEIEFPELAKMVQGEENNIFSNTLGESVIVEIQSDSDKTTALLAKVMASEWETAKLLASEVHRNIDLSEVPFTVKIPADLDICIKDIGIWIDPIDSTADYINGGETIDIESGLHLNGLRCVTVLIGVYLKSTGDPILGVVNQPFYTNFNGMWKGISYWGYNKNGIGECSIANGGDSNKVAVLSRCEDDYLKNKLLANNFTMVEASGAGYKILSVALGQADVYILSKGSTYRWDTCAPQSLLLSLGGGILDYQKFITNPDSDDLNVKYLTSSTNFSNSGGLIAYRNKEILEILKFILCK
ncbi:inositol polyphosphate 1-phosphatase isoform X1 [Prorops nasuta]|uniref:inositol polyphosphate 1-phosphatase isoform X1 n=1 Tax=Prorops nasuta TaxID=863751 RepID=UPI0034CFF12C